MWHLLEFPKRDRSRSKVGSKIIQRNWGQYDWWDLSGRSIVDWFLQEDRTLRRQFDHSARFQLCHDFAARNWTRCKLIGEAFVKKDFRNQFTWLSRMHDVGSPKNFGLWTNKESLSFLWTWLWRVQANLRGPRKHPYWSEQTQCSIL